MPAKSSIRFLGGDVRRFAPPVQSIALFDALYGPHENIQKWIREKTRAKEKFLFSMTVLYPNLRTKRRLSVDIYSQDYKRLFKGSKITAEQELPEGVSL